MASEKDAIARARLGEDLVANFRRALDEMEKAATENIARGKAIQSRVRQLRRQLDNGATVTEAVSREEPPRVVELITANMTTLQVQGAEFRAAKAHALRGEGMTIEAIAGLFGVTRQRISALLRQRSTWTPPPA